MDKNEKNADFIKEQYTQYWEMIRLHSAFSWQIPALAIVAVVSFISFGPDNLPGWMRTPLVAGFTFLVVGLFVGVMFIHHRRNLLFVRKYEQAVAKLEKDYGLVMQVHHFQILPQLKGWQRISSSTSLSIFLFLLAMSLLGTSIFFFSMIF
jgi:hypothetical protein